MTNNEWIEAARKLATPHQNEEKRPGMVAYMRNQFEFLGITGPERKLWFKALEKALGFPDFTAVTSLVDALLEQSEREFHYLAIHVVERKKHYLQPTAIPILEKLITTHGWWDTVDWISVKLVGGYFKTFPEQQEVVSTNWSVHENLWLRRTALLFSLKYKELTPWALLEQHMRVLSSENEFFIQKAIGWVLREKSKTHPAFTQSMLEKLDLSNLAKREASKYL